MNAGHKLVVYDANPAPGKELQAKGAKSVGSAAEVAKEAKTVITMLPNDKIVQAVADEIMPHMAGGLHIGCSTISPSTARTVAQQHKQAKSRYVSAPVFARPDGIQRREATFMVAGGAADVETAKNLLQTSSTRIELFGEDPGQANVAKLCGNYLIAASIQSMAEAMALAEKQGVDRLQVMRLLNSTIFDCLIYRGYGQRVSERDHKPGGFALELGLKDVSLVQAAARDVGVPMPILSVLVDRFTSSKARGRQNMDWSAVAMSTAEDSGIDISADLERNFRLADPNK
jgi:3-hydroxyisobutyrate dehydrogenase-like beta-hydroxyacid dehydrogenase